ncbi:hypothetical protein V8E55_008639 [Tylopilus felleus]
MHPALEIPEILLDIFHHCCPPDLSEVDRKEAIPDLATLARSCRTFKEPALDVLWGVLIDLPPLVRCLPEASSRKTSLKKMHLSFFCHSAAEQYSFNRRLTPADWDVIQSYTRRIRFIHHFTRGLDRKAIKALSEPLGTEPLFPNLRVLRYEYAERYTCLLHLPFLSLDSLFVNFSYSQLSQGPPVSLPTLCPDVRILSIRVHSSMTTFRKIESSHICRWQSLQSVICPEVALDTDALVHLSRMPALTTLHFALNATSSHSDSFLFFSNVHDLTLNSASLNLISQLLSRTRLPTITNFSAGISCYPSGQDLSYFFAGFQTFGFCHTMQTFSLTQSSYFYRGSEVLLDLEHLQPCMAFCNLRHMELNIECNVGLTDGDVLALASAWPQLQHLLINTYWGWGWDSESLGGGVTPGGFLRLLQMCRSLSRVAIALDTRGYTKLHPDHAPERLGLTLPPAFSIDVLDSLIRAES